MSRILAPNTSPQKARRNTPSMIGALLDGPLSDALDAAAGDIDELYGPEALALTLDRPTSKPYQLEPGHDWRLDPVV